MIKITWDETKVNNSGSTSAGLLTATDWNDMVTDQKTRLTASSLTIASNMNIVYDTTPELGGYLDAGAHGIGFTLNTITTNTINWTLGNKAAATLTANSTIYFIPPTKPSNLLFVVTQNTTGTGNTITWGTTVRWSGGTAPVLTTTTSKADIISLFYNGSSFYGLGSLNF